MSENDLFLVLDRYMSKNSNENLDAPTTES